MAVEEGCAGSASDGGGCVHLLSAFTCRIVGREVFLAESPRSLVVGLALGERWVPRGVIAERLWPDTEPERAAKRLRQTLWRIRRLTADRVVRVNQELVGLAEGACVDFNAAAGLAEFVLAPTTTFGDLAAHPVRWKPLGLPLLPGSLAEEVHLARQRWDRVRLLALEKLADAMLSQGNIPAAIELASSALAVDDLNEGPYRVIAQAHLARNDHATARRTYDHYSLLLRDNLGVDPSPQFRRILAGAGFP